ncbi:MAG: SH3 domain-containing protein [Myxococcota bacterium]
MQKRSDLPVVDVPDQKSDRPVWTKVGIIAVIGFVIGIAWPRLAGIQLGPTPPEGKPKKPAAAASVAAPEPVPFASAFASASASAANRPKPVEVQTVVVKKTDVLSCRDERNDKVDECDRPDFDTLLMPLVKDLERCPSAAGLAGKLSVGFDIDFRRNRVRLLHGKSTTIPHSTVAGIWTCANEALDAVKLDGMQHDQRRYVVYYAAYFFPPGKIIEPGMESDEPERDYRVADGKEAGPASVMGTAQIVYDTVLVRDEPKTGKVVARLVRGTTVELLSKKGSWYRIRFQEREGWVYRGAIAQ